LADGGGGEQKHAAENYDKKFGVHGGRVSREWSGKARPLAAGSRRLAAFLARERDARV
jgi:hypothetical protein